MTVEITRTEAVWTCGVCGVEARTELTPPRPGGAATPPKDWADVTVVGGGEPSSSRTVCGSCIKPIHRALRRRVGMELLA